MVQQEKAKKSQAIVKKLSERRDLTAQQKSVWSVISPP
jgi:hypothetical protein